MEGHIILGVQSHDGALTTLKRTNMYNQNASQQNSQIDHAWTCKMNDADNCLKAQNTPKNTLQKL